LNLSEVAAYAFVPCYETLQVFSWSLCLRCNLTHNGESWWCFTHTLTTKGYSGGVHVAWYLFGFSDLSVKYSRVSVCRCKFIIQWRCHLNMEMLSAVCGLGIVNITTACVGKTCFNIYVTCCSIVQIQKWGYDLYACRFIFIWEMTKLWYIAILHALHSY
jgi:hypothetical protein